MISTAPGAEPVDALLVLDGQANEANFNGDSRFFEGIVSDKEVGVWHRLAHVIPAGRRRPASGEP